MEKIFDKIRNGRVLVSDGAWGTFLMAKGLKPGECPEAWNLSRRADVLDVAKSYVSAGADMIESNSFGASRIKLEHYGLKDQAFEISRVAAAISREAAGSNVHVLGSIGPTGRFLENEEIGEIELFEVFREQARALEEGGADAACIETMVSLREALLAVKAVKESTHLEIICTFTFAKTPSRGYRTMMGAAPKDIVEPLARAGTDIIGVNCGNGMEQFLEIVWEMRSVDPTIPILVHANAGLPEIVNGAVYYPQTPSHMAGLVKKLVEAGANIIGGCCGTTPDHIRAIADSIRKLSEGKYV
jgi:5-methyltetrahydrofolate--homocysteine methyltransferase